MKKAKLIIGICIFLFTIPLIAQKVLVNRKWEVENFPALQNTEKIQESNILVANKRLSGFAHLIKLAIIDRKTAAKEADDPQKFENTFRWLKYTPRNTYIRYVQDIEKEVKNPRSKVDCKLENFILAGMGTPCELKANLQIKLKEADGVKLTGLEKIKALTFNQRSGVELTQFDFLYKTDDEKRKPVGSLRKSLILLFKADKDGNLIKDKDGKAIINMVVTKIVYDHLSEGMKYTQLILDPSPMDEQMNDVVIYDRYNQKPTTISLLGMMANSANFPHRLRFKRKFYLKVLDHFFRLYRMVSGYATRDNDSYNEKVIKKVENGLTY